LRETLITGGWNGNAALSSAEIYNLKTGTFSTTGSMKEGARNIVQSTCSMAASDYGRFDSSGNPIASAEIYDPAKRTFHIRKEVHARGQKRPPHEHRRRGKVLITGALAPAAPLGNCRAI